MKKLLWLCFFSMALASIFLGIAQAVVTLNTTDNQQCDGREAALTEFHCQVVYSDTAMEVVDAANSKCWAIYIKKPLTGAVPAACKNRPYPTDKVTGTQLLSFTQVGANMGQALSRIGEALIQWTENGLRSN